MAKQDLFTALAACGLEKTGAVSCGVWKGYAVSVRMTQGYYWIDFAVRVGNDARRLQKALAAALKAQCGKRVTVDLVNGKGKTASFLLRLNNKSPYEEQFAALADAGAAALRDQGLAPAETCAVCGGQKPESLCFIGSYQPVHQGCVRSLAETTRQKAEQNELNGSYLTGAVGALLGMLVGLIPNVAIGVASDRIYAVLFALVPLAAMWCYRKFNGKMSAGSIGIIIVVSLLGVFVMQFATLAIYIMREYGAELGESLAYTAELFRDGEVFGEILRSSLMHFLFMGLGILFAWRYLNQTNRGTVAGMEAALSTLRPNPAVSQEDGEL